MQVSHDSIVVGATVGLVSTAIPDGIVSLASKVFVGVMVALLSGVAHSAGKALFHKLFPHKPKPGKPEPPPRDGDNDMLN